MCFLAHDSSEENLGDSWQMDQARAEFSLSVSASVLSANVSGEATIRRKRHLVERPQLVVLRKARL